MITLLTMMARKFLLMALFGFLITAPAAQAQSLFDKLKKAVRDQDNTQSGDKKSNADLTGISTGEMSGALKEALNIGVKEGIQKLGAEDGFFKNELVKILLPEKLRKVDATLRSIGLGSLADRGLLLLNRAAEDAVQEGVPIFANAITSMTLTMRRTSC